MLIRQVVGSRTRQPLFLCLCEFAIRNARGSEQNEHPFDSIDPASGLLELPRTYARHALLLDLRKTPARSQRNRLFRVVRAAAQALDRNGRIGAKVSAA